MIVRFLNWLFDTSNGKGTNSFGPGGGLDRCKCPNCGITHNCNETHYDGGGPL